MRLRYNRRGHLLPRDVTMTRLTVFLSLCTVRQYAPATAAGWGEVLILSPVARPAWEARG